MAMMAAKAATAELRPLLQELAGGVQEVRLGVFGVRPNPHIRCHRQERPWAGVRALH